MRSSMASNMKDFEIVEEKVIDFGAVAATLWAVTPIDLDGKLLPMRKGVEIIHAQQLFTLDELKQIVQALENWTKDTIP